MTNEGFDYTDDEGHDYDDDNNDNEDSQQEQQQEQGQPQSQSQDRNKEQKNKKNENYDDDDDGSYYNELISEGYTVEGDARHSTLIRLIDGAIKRKSKNVSMEDVLAFCKNWNQNCCKPEPVSNEEFQECVDEVLNRNGEFYEEFFDGKKSSLSSSDSYNHRKLLEESFPELKGNVYYRINVNPAKFIVAFKATSHVIEIEAGLSLVWDKDDKRMRLQCSTTHKKTFLMCIPTKITRHLNPFRDIEAEESAPKHSITFVDQKKEQHSFTHKTLSGIISILKDHNYVFGDGAEYALSAIILGFNQMGKLRNNNDVDVEGFFIEKATGKIKPSKVDIVNEPNIAELTSALDFIDELTKYYGDDRLDLLATSLVWGMVAPVIFIVKTNEYYLEALYLYGASNALKTTTGRIILAIDGHHDDPKYALKFTHMDTIAKFGNKISKTTFPILMDEVILSSVGIIKDRDKEKIINAIKIAVDNKMGRQKFEYSSDTDPIPIYALSPLILTSESPPPTYSAGFMKRTIARHHTQSESKDPNDPESIACKEFMRTDLGRLGALGRFRNSYVKNNQEYILDPKRPPPLDIGYEILTKAYEYAGKQVPEWLSRRLPRNQLEETIEENAVIVKRAFEKYILERVKDVSYVWNTTENNALDDLKHDQISHRLFVMALHKQIPDMKLQKPNLSDDDNKIIIWSGFLQELYRCGVTPDQCPNLRQLAQCLGADYKKYIGKMVVKATKAQMYDYFDKVEVEVEEEKEENQ